jgi:hypothetical protein
MTEKINKPTGKLFSPEYREILKRMKNKPPELEEIADREENSQQASEPAEKITGLRT